MLVNDILDMMDKLYSEANGDTRILDEIERRTNELEQISEHRYEPWPQTDDDVNDWVGAHWDLVTTIMVEAARLLDMADEYGTMEDIAVQLEMACQLRG
jgi:hypothetical protein